VRSYRNPFRTRTSEQETLQGLRRFLRTFGAGALDMLPEQVWDRPVLIQSAPGAGKTSLLRTFTAEALREIADHPDELPALHERMSELDAIKDGQLRLLGVRLALKRDYQAIDDLELPEDKAIKVFFRLLDAKLVRAVAGALHEAAPGIDSRTLTWEPSAGGAEALERLGGPSLAGLLTWADAAHRDVLNHLDSVLPPAMEDLKGHHAPYTVRALDKATFSAGGRELGLRPLLMFDDGQDVGPARRTHLLDALSDRDLSLHRWVAERYQALTADELIGDGEVDRGYTKMHIEAEARQLGATRRRGHKTRGFERLLGEIADLRAAHMLHTAAEDERPFSELLDPELEEADDRIKAIRSALDARLLALGEGNPRYDEWLSWAQSRAGQRGAVERRVVEILMERDKDRLQDNLFTVALTEDELKSRWGSGGLSEAAALFLRQEFNLPFYAGTERLARLASDNIDQHLTVCGELFEEILARATLNLPLSLDADRQDKIVADASETFWRNIPRRLAAGREIQQLLFKIAEICRRDTYRKTAPYPPGATGTAISMADRQKLIDGRWREGVPGAEDLYLAMSGAIGHNLLRADLDYAVKGDRWMVLYLNRMLCARFGLPLGYGGFRERKVEDLCALMAEPLSQGSEPVEWSPIQEELSL
jgi:hypothetical protein